jgi:hypothetical protein
MSSLQLAFLITIGSTLAIAVIAIWTRARTQLSTRRWMRYLRRWVPTDAVLPVGAQLRLHNPRATQCLRAARATVDQPAVRLRQLRRIGQTGLRALQRDEQRTVGDADVGVDLNDRDPDLRGRPQVFLTL